MVLNKREQFIAITLGVVLLLLVIDRYAFTPYLTQRAHLIDLMNTATDHDRRETRLLANAPKVEQAWKGMVAGGLTSDPVAGETQALHSLRDWAQNARLELQSLKTDRATRSGDFLQIRIQVTGAAALASIAQFMQSIENSAVPLRMTEFRANSRKDGADDLAFSMTVTTIVYAPAPEAAKAPARTSSKGQS